MTLNPKQQEAVEHGDGPLLVIAGAGSGKTRTLTARLARLIERGVPPARIIAITFTNKAANEMAERIMRALPRGTNLPFIGTFHSFGASILREEAPHLNRTPHFTIFDDDDSLSLLKKIVKSMKTDGMDPPSPALLLRRVYGIKNTLSSIEDERDPRARAALARYETLLAEQNAFDFGDLIEKPVALFRAYPDILAKHQGRYSHILVDEYQDVNPAQYAFVKLLAERHRNLAVVGDDAQAIYGWRDANVEHFLSFADDWKDARVIKLEQNYRSTQTIIESAGGVVSHNTFQHEKTLWTENEAGGSIKVVGTKNAEEEADFIAQTIKEFPSSHSQFSTIAILYRTNAQSRAIEQALIAAEIPYRIFGGVKFYERKEVKDVLAALRIAANPKDAISRDRLEKALPKRIARPLVEKLAEQGDEANHLELVSLFLSESNYFEVLRHEYPNAEERIENINELIAFAGGFKTLHEFLERAALLQATDRPSGKLPLAHYQFPSTVSLMTIHMAKGLEFDEVFVAGASEGILPHQMSYATLAELEEERRLMYVAMTRARKKLTMTFYRIPSRFLYEIPPELTEFISLSGNTEGLPDDDIVYVDE